MKTVEIKAFKNRADWLEARKDRIGASDASIILGYNPWKNIQQLYEEKTSTEPIEEITNSAIEYGSKAEAPLRELFKLDHPEMTVCYEENNMWLNGDYPFAHYSSDGWMFDKDGRLGVLEVKTTTILSSAKGAEWNGQIPDYYFCQLLHEMAISEAEFAILLAQLKYEKPDADLYKGIREYRVERKDYEDDIKYLMEKEKEFMENIKNGIEPNFVLPPL